MLTNTVKKEVLKALLEYETTAKIGSYCNSSGARSFVSLLTRRITGLSPSQRTVLNAQIPLLWKQLKCTFSTFFSGWQGRERRGRTMRGKDRKTDDKSPGASEEDYREYGASAAGSGDQVYLSNMNTLKLTGVVKAIMMRISKSIKSAKTPSWYFPTCSRGRNKIPE